ncbi:hypothetical protein GGI25_000152 [Coemansia spiralis]|uniref:ATP synthase F(0) complex subunit e, mitochondrial n=2 Tax=Coemansia TaxID=4863 RepID=A0A9W8GF50_9FUNG|nr:ATP synthase E chain-domain-containing protein [Coemansia spiralis]KAJ1992480.1 hypothetical protein EDC05_002797 [Coemansia umbellata]KAJ2621810.1 hypothetical protein GGI26_003790 [Coemansia sp. RSA 1358]KAJ2681197.1 hypothetical protein GGI25_000152 [Coemansia spiralis]
MSASVRQVSSLFKIGRWAALGAGLSYGYVHARSLSKDAEAKRIDNEYARKVALIEEAKRKYAEKKAAESGNTGETFNFDDPSFDFDRWAKHFESKF